MASTRGFVLRAVLIKALGLGPAANSRSGYSICSTAVDTTPTPLPAKLDSLLSNFLPCGANYGPGLGYACRGRFLLLALDRASVRRSEASAMFGPRTLHCPSCQSAAEMRHCSKPQITSIIRAVPPLPEGRFAIVTNVRWDAMAALMSQDEGH